MGSDKVLESGKKMAKFHQLHPEENMIERTKRSDSWWVRSAPRGTIYLVNLDDTYTCDCPYFEFKGTCKHVYAVMYVRGQIK